MRALAVAALLAIPAAAASDAVAAMVAAATPAAFATADTAVYDAPPVTVTAARPRATAGGTSAVDVALDSARVAPAPTLEQVLREMPLVVIRANSRGEAQPALRGGEDRQIAVLVDGVPITLAWDHRSDLSVVPLTAARGVTLHRGLASLLAGPNAVGGAVEVDVSRGARADLPPPPWSIGAGVDHTGGRSAAIAAGLQRRSPAGLWTVRAGAGYRGRDGVALAKRLDGGDPATRARLTDDGDLRLNTDVEAFDGFLSLRRTGREGQWLAFTGTGYRLERGVAPEAHTADPRLWRYPMQARGLAALSAGTGMRATPWGRGDLEASLGVDVSRTEIEEYDGLDYRTVVGGEDDEDRTLSARLIGDHTLGGRGDLRFGATYADVSHDEVIGGGPEARYRQRLWSVAAETDWRVRLGVPVRLSFGAAADGADTPRSSDQPALDPLVDWAGRAGATAVLRGGALRVHGSAGRRARLPALRELYSGALGRFLDNPDLGPEVAWVNELGATVRHARGEVQVVGFHQVIEDGIARVSVSTPGGNRFQRVNLGRITGDGVEATGDVRLGAVRAGADVTVQRVRQRLGNRDDGELEYEPGVQGGAWSEVGLPWRSQVGIEARGAGGQRYIDLDSGTLLTLAPSLRLDLRLSRGFALAGGGPWRRLDVVLALENLADLAIFDQAGLPQPGRTVRLQMRAWQQPVRRPRR